MVVCLRGMGCGGAGFGGEEEAEKSELVDVSYQIYVPGTTSRVAMSTQTPTPTHASARLLTPHTCYPKPPLRLTHSPAHPHDNFLYHVYTSVPPPSPQSFACPDIDRNPQLGALEARGASLFIATPLTAPTFLSPSLQFPHLHAHPFGHLASSPPWRQDAQSFTAHRRKR